VISIGRLSNATAAADYYLTRQAGCPMDYYTGAGERRGLWIGRGAHALHLTGELTTAHEHVFRQLLHGLGPEGKPLVGPVLRTDPRGLLDARPLVEAIRAADTELLRSGDPGHWHTFDALARQGELVRRLLTSGAGVDVVVGPAGTGKTRALRAAREAWEANGHTVIGASLAAVAARELQNGSGIPATSLARFLGDLQRTGLPERVVIVVDEASMIGTRQHLELLEAAAAHGAKLVLVGDPRQLSEIEAGGLFASLARSPEALQLTINQRQVEDWERAALAALRDGDPGVALDAYADHDRVRLAADRQQLLDRLTADYLLARSAAPDEDVLVLAVRNSDVRSVNAEVRGRLREHGVLGTDEVRVGTEERARTYAAGDEVVITRNDYRLQVFNGTRAHVKHVDARSGQLSLSTRGGHEVVVPAAWAADRLDHAYAMTCHRAQGITVDVALLYGTAALSREAAYVAMSRGRMANYIYATHEELRGYDECGLDEHAQDADEVTLMAAQALGDAVSRSRRQRLAQDCLPLRHAEAGEVSLRRGLGEAG
jgi:ATP-dependent exoDNAse (exonuclease V) alpha subunit